jgi:hypothetical protein
MQILSHYFKKGDKSDITNYRPISMLPTFSKVLKKIMYHRLNQHLQINDVLVGEQFGFCKNMSIEHAAYSLTNEIRQARNRKSHVVGIFCDLAKAFDSVHHEILISKVEHYGVCDINLSWLKSYLSSRKQRVHLKYNNNLDCFSGWKIDKQGVPQGSVLGPLPFKVYINDFPLCINTFSHVILFADDAIVWATAKNCEDLKFNINYTLSFASTWFSANKLVLNVAETNTVNFSPINSIDAKLEVNYDNICITEIPEIKFLGITVYSSLKWRAHMDSVLPKLSSAVFVLRKLSYILDLEMLYMVYMAYFHSFIKFGIIL